MTATAVTTSPFSHSGYDTTCLQARQYRRTALHVDIYWHSCNKDT